MFPNQNPYNYALNNPISFKGTSGLAPEKEKGGKNQIQWANIPWYGNNSDPLILDRMYFEVRYPGGTEFVSWNKAKDNTLKVFYNEIKIIGNWRQHD